MTTKLKNKKLATAAFAGLLAMGAFSAAPAFAGSHGTNGCSAAGCNAKTEKNACKTKSGCKSSCKAKSGCKDANACKSKCTKSKEQCSKKKSQCTKKSQQHHNNNDRYND
ncbi:MAG: hypothetical protein ACRBDI_08420 [Alphaproteobacteria bacterium]